jgi:5'-AMP-activated protein kinase, catalytic alpha subunit
MPVQSYAPYGTNAVRTVGKQRPRSGAGVRQGGNARVPMKNRQQPGKTVGHYMLGKTIGEGTFGKVKMGTHILTGEKVAVKVLEKSRICEKADVTRVAREIKILKRNLHHNVIQLFEVLDTPATIYLIMENADRGELFDYIVAHQRVEEPQACYFFHQIIDGVDYLHQMEVTHRDLKPENLLLQNSSRGLIVKIVDFGLSNTHDGGRKLKTACGSPCYAAPEMIAGNGEKYYEGPKADLWSVGVILFALVCGYLPFEDANTTKLYKKILAVVQSYRYETGPCC